MDKDPLRKIRQKGGNPFVHRNSFFKGLQTSKSSSPSINVPSDCNVSKRLLSHPMIRRSHISQSTAPVKRRSSKYVSSNTHITGPATVSVLNASNFNSTSTTSSSTATVPIIDIATTTSSRRAPSSRETMQNLNPLILANINEPKEKLKSALKLVELNVNTDAMCGDDAKSGKEDTLIEELGDEKQLITDGMRYSDAEIDTMLDALNAVVAEPDKYGKGGMILWRSVKKEMGSGRSVNSLKSKATSIRKNKSAHGHSEMNKIFVILNGRRSNNADVQ